MSKCVCTHRRRDHEGEFPQPCWVVDCPCLGFYDVELLPVSTIPAYTREEPRLPWLEEVAAYMENTMSDKICLCGHSSYNHINTSEACLDNCDCLWFTTEDDLEDEENWLLEDPEDFDQDDEDFCDYIEGNQDDDSDEVEDYLRECNTQPGPGYRT